MTATTTIQVRSKQKMELIDITGQARAFVRESGCQSGALVLFAPHTTAGLTINENADPCVRHDIQEFLRTHFPAENYFQHAEGNSPAHILSTLVGASLQLIIEAGELLLGTWQALYFCEFDGPRSRQVHMKIVPG